MIQQKRHLDTKIRNRNKTDNSLTGNEIKTVNRKSPNSSKRVKASETSVPSMRIVSMQRETIETNPGAED